MNYINKFCTFSSLENVPSENIEIGDTLQGIAVSSNIFLLHDDKTILGTFGCIVDKPSHILMSEKQNELYIK